VRSIVRILEMKIKWGGKGRGGEGKSDLKHHSSITWYSPLFFVLLTALKDV
jgi:hypothetical protein